MAISKLEPRRPWEQVRRDSAELQRVGKSAGLTHVGAVVADVVMPIVARHELDRALRHPAGFQMELCTEVAEMMSR